MKSVIGDGRTIVRSAGTDNGSHPVTARPARKTPERDAVKNASSHITKVVTKVSDSIKTGAERRHRRRQRMRTGVRAQRSKSAESEQPRVERSRGCYPKRQRHPGLCPREGAIGPPIRERRQAPTGRHANPTLAGGSDDEAARTRRCRLERLPARRLRTSGDIALSYRPHSFRRPELDVSTVRVTRSTGFRRRRLMNLVSRSLLSLWWCAATASSTYPLPGPARDDVDLQLCLSELPRPVVDGQLPRRWWMGAVAAPLPCVERERHPVQPHGTGRPGSAETLPASGVVVASYAVGGSAIHTLTQMANGLCCNRYPRRAGCPENK